MGPVDPGHQSIRSSLRLRFACAPKTPMLEMLSSTLDRQWCAGSCPPRVSVSWDPSWPALPALSGARGLRIDEARALYAFAGKNPDVLKHIPCYCSCQSEGHQSNHDCYVGQRSTDGRVIEWNSHGMTCPVGPDITGDVMLWREKGRTLSTIRDDIDHEYGSRGPATPTPRPPTR